MHEMGHALGLNDSYLRQDRNSVMYGYLTKGERRLPAKGQAIGAVPGSLSATPHFLGAPVSIGTLPPGKGVSIQYAVTIGPIAGNPQQTASQGTVSGGNFSNVLTDDPTVGGATDPTVTLLGIAPAFTSGASTTFTVGTLGTFNVTANGAPPPSFTKVGALPTGVTLSAGGVLSGTPAAGTGGSYPITITASNGIGSNAMQSFTLTVNQPAAITSANSTTFVVGTNGTFTVTASGFPASTFSQTGALPSGVTLSAAGVLSGTPAAGTGGTYPITITANNGVGSPAMQSFTLTVNQAPSITSVNSTSFTEGNNGSFTVTASGLPTPTFSESGALPNAVTLSPAGLLSGTPDAGTAGSYPITITASNGVGSNAQQPFTLNVAAAVCTAPPSGMISWFAANGNALDLIGAHDGTLISGATATAAAKVGQGFTLNGTSDYVSIAGGALVASQAAFTVDAWFKTTSGSGFEPIYSESHTTDGNPFLYAGLLNGKLHFTARGTGATMAITSVASYNDGAFHLAAFVKQSDNSWEMFVDGVSVGTSTTAVGTLTLNRSEMGRFGQGAGAADFFLGQIDETELFNRALTQPEILALYNASIAGKCRPALALASAVSRKTHGAAGTFDVPLPLSGAPGVECRSGGANGDHTVVFSFSNGVASGTASVTSGAGSVSGSPTFTGNAMSVNLTGVSNAQQITVQLSTVTDAVGQVLPNTSVSMNVLLGDVTANKSVTASDIALIKAETANPIGAGNFRADVSLNGMINGSDLAMTKAASGTGIP